MIKWDKGLHKCNIEWEERIETMNTIIRKTESLCPICLERVPAVLREENGDVYMAKTCPEHGDFKALLWRDADLYRRWERACVHADPVEKHMTERDRGCPFDCGLCPDHEGGTCTAVMEITNACNMACPICFAQAGQIEPFNPGMEEIRSMYQTILDSGGICSVQLSGGEPTVRDDLPEIIKMGKAMGFKHIQVNTNGIRISEEYAYLEALKEAGADLIYLQFDGTREEIHRFTRGREMLSVKEAAIENCGKAGIGVLLVPVIVRGLNDDNLGDILRFAKGRMPVVKGIHFQPASWFGRFPYEQPSDEKRMTLPDVLKGLIEQTDDGIEMDHFIPRKRFDSHCAFSSLFLLDYEGRLHAATKIGAESKELIRERMEAYKSSKREKDNSDYFTSGANTFTDKHWRMGGKGGNGDWDAIERIRDYRLSISGMPFQDVWNLDIDRLKGCCVHVVGAENRLIPLCAYHLTAADGTRIYGAKGE